MRTEEGARALEPHGSNSQPARMTASMVRTPCPDCGHVLVRARRRWYQRLHVRSVRRCTGCGARFNLPFPPGERVVRARVQRVMLGLLVFVVVAVVCPALTIYFLPAHDDGPQVVEE